MKWGPWQIVPGVALAMLLAAVAAWGLGVPAAELAIKPDSPLSIRVPQEEEEDFLPATQAMGSYRSETPDERLGRVKAEAMREVSKWAAQRVAR